MADRAVSPVVGKALEAGIVVVYVSVISTALFGSVVPGYQAAAGDEVADRALADAASRVDAVVPATGENVSGRARVDLPATIRGDAYRIEASGDALVLEHPHPAIEARQPLLLPPTVSRVEGVWRSDEPASVRVRRTDGGLVVSLVGGEP